MTRISAIGVPDAPRPGMFSNARVVGDRFFISGMHAGSPEGVVGREDAYAQAVEAFRRVQELTEACGAVVDDILVLRVYLTDIADKVAVGRARAEMFVGDFPCSTLVQVCALVEPGLKVEIEAEGIVGGSRPSV
ncbi:RidA family protein [Rhodococcus sp. 105337]|uniref:RidA family protein n=1 Tax=unclassified Rhodococcus (in: high G+C Gram-positive bacteria) TaxID=192944 RepID=UPI00146CE94C|nr:RidA family protein [Rhodococcus sp. 105337]NME81057.1 RidA family protein [Rhodococcus sp. 105337]